MKLLITVIVVFIIIVYGYTYIHYKKKRRQSMDHVQEFHEKYKIKKSNINELYQIVCHPQIQMPIPIPIPIHISQLIL